MENFFSLCLPPPLDPSLPVGKVGGCKFKMGELAEDE